MLYIDWQLQSAKHYKCMVSVKLENQKLKTCDLAQIVFHEMPNISEYKGHIRQ